MDPSYLGYHKKTQHREKTTNLIIDSRTPVFNDVDDSSVNLNSESNKTDSMLNKKKWKCYQCTYENWPSALKCTICLASKSLNANSNNVNKLKSTINLNRSSSNNTNKNVNTFNYATQPQQQVEPLKKRNELGSKNVGSRKANELKVKLKPESSNNSSNSNESQLSRENNSNSLNKSWCSSSSNENLNENNNSNGSNSISKIYKTKKNDFSNDIYKIGDLIIKNSAEKEFVKDPLLTPDLHQSIETQKWSCSVCTYLNWPKSIKCVQCYTTKDNSNNNNTLNQLTSTSSTSLANSVAESASFELVTDSANNKLHNKLANKLLNSSKSNMTTSLTSNDLNLSDSRSLCNSPCTVSKAQQSPDMKLTIDESNKIELQTVDDSNSSYSSTDQPSADRLTSNSGTNLNNTIKTTNKDADTLTKWSCSSCTYQNWPKSQHCVMCHVQRVNTNNNSPNINSNNTNQTNAVINNAKTTFTSTTKTNAPLIKNKEPNKKVQVKNSSYNLLKTLQIQLDRLFLSACEGVVDGDMIQLHRYVTAGGDLTRYLTSDEVQILNRPTTFTVGLTLLHLCYQFNRKDFLVKILNNQATSVQQNHNKKSNDPANKNKPKKYLVNALLKQVNNTKFSPCQSCPTLAVNIVDRYFSASLRQRKTQSRDNTNSRNNLDLVGATSTSNLPTTSLISLNTNSSQAFRNMSPSPSPPPYTFNHNTCQGATSMNSFLSQCFYVNECHTFILPSEIDDFSARIQHILFDELLDREVQQELENESRAINWNVDLINRHNSRLYPLWNRHSGDCLLDSVLQACYGVFDTDNILRHVMAESMEQYANCFKPRWKEHEILMAQSLNYTLDDYQLEQDWNNILALAHQPGSSLEQAHIFALCHIFRRPIIIYSIKYVKSFRGENIGFTHFEGVYLPLIWEPNFCFKNPIALGYTRGHFTALVPLEKSDVVTYISNNTNSNVGAVSQLENSEQNQQVFYLPLTNNEGQLLPVHFLNSSEVGRERSILRQYLNLDCMILQGSNCGMFVAQQRTVKRGVLIKQMLDEWLSYYRNMQMKEIDQPIEISHENEQLIYPHQQRTGLISMNSDCSKTGQALANSNNIINSGGNNGNDGSPSSNNNSIGNNTNLEDDDLVVNESDEDDDDDDDDYDDDNEYGDDQGIQN